MLDIRYARSSGVSIAYQVVGEGETDLVCVPDFVAGSGLVFEDRGRRRLKDVGKWELYAVV